MTTPGKAITVYLPDGAPTGLRRASLLGWVGQAIFCPRARLTDLGKDASLEICARPGVYFLISSADSTSRAQVYIGESENVYRRLMTHDREKDFWNDGVLLTSKDQTLTKGHLKYLEARFIALASGAKRADVLNGNKPPAVVRMEDSDRDYLESFILEARCMFAVLGHRFLEPIPEIVGPGGSLTFSFKGLIATGAMTDDGFVVRTGSQVAKDHVSTTPTGVKRARDRAIQDAEVVLKSNHYVLRTDKIFSSPSAGAMFVCGSSKNGLDVWKDREGRSLKDLEESSERRMNDRRHR